MMSFEIVKQIDFYLKPQPNIACCNQVR